MTRIPDDTDYDKFKAYRAELLGVKDDDYDHLFTPHRFAYVKNETPRGRSGSVDCPFCIAPTRSDEEGLIVYRGEHAFVLLNLFPYNSGHVLICPYRHISLYEETTVDERNEIAELTAKTNLALRKAYNLDGINIGFNQGEAAGAGIAAHLHQHIVPRWIGDANFFTITAGTRAVPAILEETRQKIIAAWK